MPMIDALVQQADQFVASLEHPEELLAVGSALVAAALVVLSAFVRTMIPLRWLAVGSNAGFIVYGLVHPVPLMALLHGALLPVNLWRVWQMVRLTRRGWPPAPTRDRWKSGSAPICAVAA